MDGGEKAGYGYASTYRVMVVLKAFQDNVRR